MATAAEILTPIVSRLRIVNPKDKPEGWDLADAAAEGWTQEQVIAYIKANIVDPNPTLPQSTGTVISAAQTPLETHEPSQVMMWQQLKLDMSGNQTPHSNMANVSKIIQRHPDFVGKIYYDRFAHRIYHTLYGPAKEITDEEVQKIHVFMTPNSDISIRSVTRIKQLFRQSIFMLGH